MKKAWSCIMSLVLLAPIILSVEQSGTGIVRMEEKPITIPTYLINAPERNPIFYSPTNYQGAQKRIYPYPYLGYLSNDIVNQTYKGLFLENEYIKICVLPELGGRLYIAQDKTNGYDFIYHNRVIKPALIGMVGAWISGGIEWNIPHHHRASTFMPVDYTLQENADGSKTIWVGEYEKRHQTRWVVGLTLYPGKAYVEITQRIFNTTPYVHSFLIFANAAVHANTNYQVIFPPDVEQAVFHTKNEFTTWPIARQYYRGIDFTKGVDVNWWKNISSPTSFFAWDTKMDFMGGIDHGQKAGTVLVGNHHIFPGKKVWYWGNNEVQRLWDQMLTDSDGPYLELMMGMYSDNQPDYSWNSPYSAKYGMMYLFPIQHMSSIKNANKDFAINLELAEDSAIVQAYATSSFQNINLVLTKERHTLYSEKITVDPIHPFSKQIPLDSLMKPEGLKLALLSGQGKELISYTIDPRKNKPFSDEYHPPREPREYESADELFLIGLRLEQFGNPHYDPLKYYKEALKRNPKHLLTNTQMGIWYLKKGLYSQAEKKLQIGVDQVTGNHTSPKHGEPLYYLGVSLFQQERLDEAYDLLYKATWNDEWTSAAYYLISKIDCRRGNLERALGHINRAVAGNNNNIEALNLKSMILRHLSLDEEATKMIIGALSLDPLNLTSLNEKYQLTRSSKQGQNQKKIRNDLMNIFRDEPDNYLETAARYGRAGFYQDAIELLHHAVDSNLIRLSTSPMIYYYLGHYYSRLGQNEKKNHFFKKAALLSLDYCFPYGHSSFLALKCAIAHNLSDAHAHYLLGNLYADNEPSKALKEWEKAIKIKNTMAMAYRNMAFIEAHIFDNMPKAIEHIQQAILLNPQDPLQLLEADIYYADARLSLEKRLNSLSEHSKIIANSDKLAIRKISLDNLSGLYDETINELESRHFRMAENTHINPHMEWTNAHLYRGITSLSQKAYEKALKDFHKILEFPRNLEIARDAKIGVAYYWMGKTCQAMGKSKMAGEMFSQMVAYTSRYGWGARPLALVAFYQGLAHQERNETDLADKLFHKLISDGKDALNDDLHDGLDLRGIRVRQQAADKKAGAYFSMGLGHFGLGQTAQAESMFRKALEIFPAHIDAHNFFTNKSFLNLLE